jgi:DNA-binding transcriptional LysR family regulator
MLASKICILSISWPPSLFVNFRTLDLNLLRVFDAVMAEGSLTRAAERLAMTQPAASHALKRLHVAVGEELFHRTAFGMRPPRAPRLLWPQVRAALAQLQAALSPRSFDPTSDAATFNIAMADATAAMLLPPLSRRSSRRGRSPTSACCR